MTPANADKKGAIRGDQRQVNATTAAAGPQQQISVEEAQRRMTSAGPFMAMDQDAAKTGAANIPAIRNAGEWLTSDAPPIEQILPMLLDAAAKLLLNGSSKCRKTFLVLQLAICLAARRRFLKWEPARTMRVLMLNGEVTEAHSHRRLFAMCRALGVDPRSLGDRLRVVNSRGHRFTLDDPPDWLLAAAADADLIVIDPVYKFFAGEENSGADAAAFLAGLDQLCSESGAAAVYVHHAAKGTSGDRQTIDRGSGSGVFARDFDAALYVGVHRDEPDTLVVEPIIRAYPPVDPFCIEFQDGAFRVSDALPVIQTSATRHRTAPAQYIPVIQRIVETTGPITKTALIDKVQAAGSSRNGARAAIESAISGGILIEENRYSPPRKVISLNSPFAGAQTEGGEQ
jgi:hypothetical protein